MRLLGHRALARIGIALALIVCAFRPWPAAAQEVYIGVYDWVIDGYDPVAYFVEGKAVKGDNEIWYQWQGGRWLFSSQEHKALFESNPEKYAPQYGGFCAFSMSRAARVGASGEVWSIVDGKLYLQYSPAALARWENNREDNIRRANANWENLKTQ